ncbi:MAG: GNAT family N-acetyltransferase [Pseudomonadota bacterium]
MKAIVPEKLETPRLFLRQFRSEDWKDLHRLYSDEECIRHTLGRVLTEGETWRTLACMIGHWQIHGYGPYAVEHRQTGEVLGTVGLWYPIDWPEPEIKWALARCYWSQGYALEAARAVKQMASTCLPHIRLISLIFADNTQSAKLAMALGAHLESEIDFRERRAHIFRHSQGPVSL